MTTRASTLVSWAALVVVALLAAPWADLHTPTADGTLLLAGLGIFGKIGKAVGGLGRLASKAAPVVGLIPGVGTVAGAALGAGGALIGGEGFGTALKRGALGAAGGLAGGLVGKAGGLGGVGKALGGLGLTPLDVAGLGLAGVGAVQGAQAQGRQNRLAEEAAELARQDYASRAPLRELALSGIGQEYAAPDLSGEFGGSGNPFERPLRGGGGAPASQRLTPRTSFTGTIAPTDFARVRAAEPLRGIHQRIGSPIKRARRTSSRRLTSGGTRTRTLNQRRGGGIQSRIGEALV